MQVASYFASLGFKVDKRELRQVDSHLKNIELKLKKFSQGLDKTLRIKFNIDNFDVDQRKLNLSLGNALDLASGRLVFQVDNFDINQARLNQQVANAANVASRSARVSVNTNVRGDGIAGESIRGRQVVAAGGIGGIAARMYTPALALGLGGYGLGAINRRNQEVVSAQLMTQAVVQQAGGTQQQGVQSFNWLREQADRIGFNYLEAAPDFNKLLSGLTGAGMTVGQGQDVFQGFAELSRVNKLDKTSQNRLFRALSQVAGKDQLMSEELTGQIAEALPGGVSLFAEAYQRQLAAQGKGGGLTGTEAIQALRKAMENRQVKGDILIEASQVAALKAAPGLSAAQKASQAEQQRFQNQISNTAITASQGGVESGFARLFRSMATALKESQPLVESFAKGFDKTSQYASSLLLSIQSVQRFFQGRDSFLGDMLLPDEESQQKAFLFMENLKNFMSEMDKLTSNIYNGWSQLLGMLDSSSVLEKFNTSLSIMANAAATFNKLAEGDISGAVDAAKSVGQNYANTVTSVGRTGANLLLKGAQYGLAGIDPRVTMDQITPYQIPAPFDKGQSQIDWAAQYKAEQAKMAAEARNQYTLPGINTPLAQGQVSTDLTIKMDVSIQAANPEDFNQQFQEKFKGVLAETLSQYSQKE